MNAIQEWLEKPFPLLQRTRDKALMILAFGVFIYLYLLLYRPFGGSELGKDGVWFFAGFGGVVMFSLTINYLILPRLFRKTFNPKTWNVRKEFFFILSSFILIGFLNYVYNATVGAGIAPERTLLQFMGITVAVGLFPVVVMIFLMELYLNRRNQQSASVLAQELVERPQEEDNTKILQIVPETSKSKPLEIPAADFIFAESDNNYVTVHFEDNGETKRELIRLSIKRLAEQIGESKEIIRCHRSYLVNKNRIKDVEGNARSLSVKLEGVDEDIPVSRSFPKAQLL